MTRFLELRYPGDASAGNDRAKLVRTQKSLKRMAGVPTPHRRVDPPHGA